MNQNLNWLKFNTYTSANFSVSASIDIVHTLWRDLLVRARDYTKETVEHLILASLIYIVICVTLYFAVTKWRLLSFVKDVKGQPRRVMIIIAHPDDECMFFGPTVLNMVRRKGCKVYLMCLSRGRNYGMGKIRKDELYESCKVLGVKEECVILEDHTDMPDDMAVRWPVDLVAKLILKQIETYGINTLITFDKHGVSQHKNHTSLYYAVAYLTMERKLPKDCTVYVLETVNLMRKYWLMLDIPISLILSRTRYLVSCADRALIHRAMKQHRSQLVWFRRLYMLFSRYMLINSLQRMDLSDLELDLQIDD